MKSLEEILTPNENNEHKEIIDDVNNFVNDCLSNYKPKKQSSKVIQDSIWGPIDFCSWEMQLIDSPLIQRLRDIKQLGMASLIYPCSNHTRFEHTLGVAAAAKFCVIELILIIKTPTTVLKKIWIMNLMK